MAITVAIAGGAGNIGKSISDALVASGKYNVILLGRQAPKDLPSTAPPFVAVDYNNVDAVTKVLEEHNVHTIISAIKVITPESGVSEVNLINAAAKAAPTKRFMQSEWGVPTPPENIRLPQHQVRLASVEHLRTTDLEWTQFHNGYFLDYYGMPYIETHINEPVSYVFDIPNRVAGIPGTGDDVISFTYTRDIAQFVVKALELPKWEEELYCYGDKKTFNQFLKLLEEATGSKFKVTYDSKEKLEKGEVTELPSNLAAYEFFPKQMLQMFFSRFGLYMIAGLFDVEEDKTLNKIFPDVKTTTVQDVVNLWKGK